MYYFIPTLSKELSILCIFTWKNTALYTWCAFLLENVNFIPIVLYFIARKNKYSPRL